MKGLASVTRDVSRLCNEIDYLIRRLHVETPSGWQWRRLLLSRAAEAGYGALFSDEPNYPRLLLARDQLRAVTK